MLDSANWHELAVARARDFRLRAAFGLFITLASSLLKPSLWPVIWLLTSLLAQGASLWIAAPLCKDPDYAPSARRRLAFVASVAVSTAVFAAITPFCWFSGGWEGRILAFTILAGCVLNVGLQARSCALFMWIGATPFIVLLAALPLLSFVVEPGSQRRSAAFAAVAAVLYVGHLFAALRGSVADGRALRLALYDAQQERMRAEAASAAKSEFLATMSHEIRTPLNGVLGMAQALDANELPPEQRQRLDVLRQSGEILLLLLNDLLDLSKVEAAKLELEDGLVEPPALVAHASAVFGVLASAKGVAFELRLEDSARGPRAGDPTRVRQVLFNLLGNAVKFTESGKVTATLSAVGDELVIEVADTGPGIPADRLDGLFQRFAQVDASTTRRYGGSGLGLAIARELARLMGGDITVSSVLCEGSVFTARLNLPATDEGSRQAVGEPPSTAASDGELNLSLRVLAAEDNPINQLVLRTLLEQVGIAPHIVENGREALDAWRAADWDLVLMDIQMPVMDGISAMREIRAAEALEGRPRTRIIALSANAMAHQASAYFAAGADGLVPKPIQFEQLFSAISAAAAQEPAPEMERTG